MSVRFQTYKNCYNILYKKNVMLGDYWLSNLQSAVRSINVSAAKLISFQLSRQLDFERHWVQAKHLNQALCQSIS